MNKTIQQRITNKKNFFNIPMVTDISSMFSSIDTFDEHVLDGINLSQNNPKKFNCPYKFPKKTIEFTFPKLSDTIFGSQEDIQKMLKSEEEEVILYNKTIIGKLHKTSRNIMNYLFKLKFGYPFYI